MNQLTKRSRAKLLLVRFSCILLLILFSLIVGIGGVIDFGFRVGRPLAESATEIAALGDGAKLIGEELQQLKSETRRFADLSKRAPKMKDVAINVPVPSTQTVSDVGNAIVGGATSLLGGKKPSTPKISAPTTQKVTVIPASALNTATDGVFSATDELDHALDAIVSGMPLAAEASDVFLGLNQLRRNWTGPLVFLLLFSIVVLGSGPISHLITSFSDVRDAIAILKSEDGHS
ncbi:MAG: hypothetical protein AAGJ79_00790 [Verrucomicrobiota bacterium]